MTKKKKFTQTYFDKIKHLSIDKRKLSLVFSGAVDKPLTVTIKINEADVQINSPGLSLGVVKEQEQTHVMYSDHVLIASEKNCIDDAAIEKRFKSFNNAEI